MDKHKEFELEVQKNIENLGEDHDLHALSRTWIKDSGVYGYTYNFSWLGVPIVQLPQDILAMQEIIWKTGPDLIVETGVARGGSLMMTASMLLMLDYQDAVRNGEKLDPGNPRRKVVGIDIDIRSHNRTVIESHPLANRIELIEGSSIASDVISTVQSCAREFDKVMVCLDSNHTHEHVLAELRAYAPLVTHGCYCVVFDTLIEDRLPGSFPNRPWDKGNNPKTAALEYLQESDRFEIDKAIDHKLLISVAPDGYLKCVKD